MPLKVGQIVRCKTVEEMISSGFEQRIGGGFNTPHDSYTGSMVIEHAGKIYKIRDHRGDFYYLNHIDGSSVGWRWTEDMLSADIKQTITVGDNHARF